MIILTLQRKIHFFLLRHFYILKSILYLSFLYLKWISSFISQWPIPHSDCFTYSLLTHSLYHIPATSKTLEQCCKKNQTHLSILMSLLSLLALTSDSSHHCLYTCHLCPLYDVLNAIIPNQESGQGNHIRFYLSKLLSPPDFQLNDQKMLWHIRDFNMYPRIIQEYYINERAVIQFFCFSLKY